MTSAEQDVPDAVVELQGGIAPDLVDYTRQKLEAVLGHTGRAVLRVRVRVLRHRDPARSRPVVARADVDLAGRPIRVHVAATRPREAVDLLVERLDHRLERLQRPFRRVRPPTVPGPDPTDPEVVRHAPVSARSCSVEDAIGELDDLGFDFHLFTDIVSGQDAVVYRDGPTGLRLALAGGDTRGPYSAAVTISPHPAPVLDADGAVQRMTLTGLPFVFYVDADHGRGALLYRGHDGCFGLVDQARDRH